MCFNISRCTYFHQWTHLKECWNKFTNFFADFFGEEILQEMDYPKEKGGFFLDPYMMLIRHCFLSFTGSLEFPQTPYGVNIWRTNIARRCILFLSQQRELLMFGEKWSISEKRWSIIFGVKSRIGVQVSSLTTGQDQGLLFLHKVKRLWRRN